MKETTYLQENNRLIDFLKKIPVFEPFDETELTNLLKISKMKVYASRECIIREGSMDSLIYFLVSGKVRITKSRRDIAILKRRGDIFGEMGVISLAPRTASAHADGKTICLTTDFYLIENLAGEDRILFGYVLYRIFSEILVNRLKMTTDELMRFKGKGSLKFW
ncbi:hypothetical protein D3OALGA1CA_302 [Olavius algarvensis associated proteobacterium Delta 3]|nr:hypothetical protein D3OALGA1CA_302 [Olavius algarvensis associated proteobacterium Delta 3]